MNNETTVKPSQFKALLRTLAEVDLVPFVMSSPGLGKSMMAYQLAQEWGLRWIDIRLAYRSPVDIIGYPMARRTEDGRDVMVFAQPGELPVEEGNFIIFDEFSCASKATANASLQMVLDRKVGDYHLPKETFLMLAGNRRRDKCHVEQLASALVNRVCMVTLEADSKDWLEWAAENGVHPLVQAFIRVRPELLSAFDGGEWDHESGFPSPRSW
ncbi:MAG: hypothetical protein Q8P59_12545, partial [Dehalococcoidia bacterium]|nr:hypothetical protein [Dehalococcoidia bacterium]